MSLTSNASSQVSTSSTAKTGKFVATVLAAFFGIGLLYGSGFAEMSQLHNAAHDGRHSAGFPCH